MSAEEAATWHYGLIARWWAEFNESEEQEVAFYRSAIERYGQPALDLACGTGRILLPLLKYGLDVDGVDLSEDMLNFCRDAADALRLHPTLILAGTQSFRVSRTYRTIYICGSFGLGCTREEDLEVLRRCHSHLQPGGALIFNFDAPYTDERLWSGWTPAGRASLPPPWRDHGMRKRCRDGNEIELLARTLDVDPIAQRQTREMRAILWREGQKVKEERHVLTENLYFIHEVDMMLRAAGFGDVSFSGGLSEAAPTADDETIMATAIK